ncbi:hypothetical protein ACQEU3_46920 [Spirillospora sp. CA-253888]
MTRWWRRWLRPRYATGGTLPTRPLSDDTIPAILSPGAHSWEIRDEAYDFTEEQVQRLMDAMPADPLHAHEITAADAIVIAMLAGARFEDDATVVLPSGRAITGAEMRRWVEGGGP